MGSIRFEAPFIMPMEEQELYMLTDGKIPVFLGSVYDMEIINDINRVLYGGDSVRNFRTVPGLFSLQVDCMLGFKDRME